MNDVICSTVASTLDDMELNYRNDGEVFIFTIGDDDADFTIRILGDEKNELLTVVGFFPVKVSKMNLDKMYRFINDLNYKTMVGFFSPLIPRMESSHSALPTMWMEAPSMKTL